MGHDAAQIKNMDVLEWAEQYKGSKFHAMLCDAPYEMNFMGSGKKNWWDNTGIAFRPETWKALAQHLLPGAFGMCFGSARGWHRLACAIEDAGLIIHPSVFFLWAYGSGFPKATRIDTAVDKAAGIEREVIGENPCRKGRTPTGYHEGWIRPWQSNPESGAFKLTAPATDLAATWTGHRYGGQVLKPALEPVIVWQVPYQGRPVDSITATGAGALWIEGSRVGAQTDTRRRKGQSPGGFPHNDDAWIPHLAEAGHIGKRWPPNLALLHLPTCTPLGPCQVPGVNAPGSGLRPSRGYSGPGVSREGMPIQQYASPDGTEVVQAYACAPECPVRRFDAQAGERGGKWGQQGKEGAQSHIGFHMKASASTSDAFIGDSGPASRFMYTADWALDVAEQLAHADPVFYTGKASQAERDEGLSRPNNHPCIKPLSLCTWLATLLLPPAAYAPRRLLSPFCGTGSEMIGATLAGWDEIVGIEQDPATVALATQRLRWWTTQIAAQLSLWPS
jgi:hypothetical protein